MKKTYLALIPLLGLVFSGCTGNKPTPTPGPEDDDEINTVKEVRESVSAPYAEITGRVVEKGRSSYIIYDGTGLILHYSYSQTQSLSIGDKVTVKGQTGYKNGLAQFDDDATVMPYSGDVPEFDYTPRQVDSFNNFALDTIEYISVPSAVCYKSENAEGNKYYQTRVFSDGSNSYLSMGDSQRDYTAIFDSTSEDSPLIYSLKGFVIGLTPASVGTPTSRYNFLLDEEPEEVELHVQRMILSDQTPYLNLTTSFDKFAKLNIYAMYQEELVRVINMSETTYVVTNSAGLEIDTSLPFAAPGQYRVKVTYEDVTSNEVEFTVYDNNDTVVNMNMAEMAVRNNWEDNKSSTSKTGTMNDDITLSVSGTSSGNYSFKNGSWTINQKGNGALTITAGEGLYIKKVFVRYSPNATDEDASRYGALEFLNNEELVGVRKNSVSYNVINTAIGVDNAFVRLKDIMVSYSDDIGEAPELVSIKAKESYNDFTLETAYDEVNQLDVVAKYDDNMQERIAKGLYDYLVTDEIGNEINSAVPFENVGNYTVKVYYHEVESNPVTIKVTNPILDSVTVVNAFDEYIVGESLEEHMDLTVTAVYTNSPSRILKPEQYTYVVLDPNGDALEHNAKFVEAGEYTLQVTFKEVVGELKFNVIVPELASLLIEDSFDGYTTFMKYDTNNQLSVHASYTNYHDVDLEKGQYDIVVKDVEGTVIDTSKFFPAAGTYSVYVQVGDIISNTLEFEVVVPDKLIASKTVDEIATYNGWSGGTRYLSGHLDDNIDLAIECGSSTGNYSSSNGTWTLMQKPKSGEAHDGALIITAKEGFVISEVTITYSPQRTDESSNRVGYLDGLENGVAATYDNVQSVYAEVIPVNPSEVNAFCRISSISVTYKIA